MVNYLHGKIYRIDIDDDAYIGSTARPYLSKRLAEHRYRSKTVSHRLYSKVVEKGGWDGISIVLIEKYPCSSKDELFARERYWIETLQPTLNTTLPVKSIEEKKEVQRLLDQKRHADKKEEISERKRINYIKNKQSISEKGKILARCPHCNKEMRKDSITRHIKLVHSS